VLLVFPVNLRKRKAVLPKSSLISAELAKTWSTKPCDRR
jgi:hypothetical protein